MRLRLSALLLAVGVAIGVSGIRLSGQRGTGAGADTPEKHIAAARDAAGQEYAWMFDTLCIGALGTAKASMQKGPVASASGAESPDPPRSSWHAEPVKVFDNLYRVGTVEHSAWAITTSSGIILMDAIFDYNVKDEVIDGLTKLGLDPTSIKYAIISHGHGDHVGGAKLLQELGTHIIMGGEDYDLLDRTNPRYKPKRDMIGTDGQKVTVGDETVTIYKTPGHTQGTLSSIFPVTDGGKPHVVAYWGGTMFNWAGGSPLYISPTTPYKYWFDTYAASAARFADIAKKAGADIIMSNHTNFDLTKLKEPELKLRKPGDAFHPYVVGQDRVQRYLKTVEECAVAGSLMSK